MPLSAAANFTKADELIALAEAHDDIAVLTADLAMSNGLSAFQQRFPKRFFNMGIAEQNMISVAAGLAATGYRPYISTIASFVSLLGAEQVRTDLAYPGMNVTILTHHVGVSLGFYGTSHKASSKKYLPATIWQSYVRLGSATLERSRTMSRPFHNRRP